ncbi:helix-turn-helix domain-containing protein [Paenalcaligenes sp. Me52]|uniref:AraC family transcriptional regulator n=1 Tax=Paenalcaligenes sp. Me52 TaxID=3392038 RepID=UPI003D286F9A
MQCALEHHKQLRSTDPEQVQSHIAQVLCPHQLHLRNPKHPLNTELYYRPGTHLGFGRLRYGTTVHIAPQPLQDFYLLQLPVHGKEQLHLHNQHLDYDLTVAAIINPEQEFAMQHADTTNKLFVRINRHSLEQFFQQHYQRPLQGLLQFAPLLSLQKEAGYSLWHMLQWQFSEASEGVLFDRLEARQRLEETFLATLLDLWPHNQPLQLTATITPHAIKKVKDYVAQNLSAALTISQIASAADISSSSLYSGFKSFVGLSPMQYVKQQRLQHIHQLLLAADPKSATVTELALQTGFCHLGQFSADYQRQFGVRPSVTLQQKGSK